MASRVLRVVISGDATGAERAFKATEKGADSLFGSVSQLGKAFRDADGGMDKLSVLGDGLTGIGTKLTRNVTLPLAGVGLAAGKLAMDFEASFAQIEGLVGVTGQDLEDLRQSALKLAGETGKAPRELAEGLYFLTSAGLDAATAQEALEYAAKGSAAGLGEVKTLADVSTSALAAYSKSGLTVAESFDIITAAVRLGKLEAPQLAAALGRVIPAAEAAGVSFADVNSAVATMSLTGLQASEGVVGLQGILKAVAKPSSEAARELENVGLSVEGLQKHLREKGLLATLRLLKERFGDNETALRRWAGEANAAGAVLSITGQDAARVDGIFEGVANSAGDMTRAFDVFSNTASFKVSAAFAEIQASGIRIGEALLPTVAKIAEAVAVAAAAFTDLPESVQTAVIALGILAAAAGPVLVAVGSLLTLAAKVGPLVATVTTTVKGVAASAGALHAAGGAAGLLTGALSGLVKILASPVFIAVAGFAGIVSLKGRLDEARKSAEDTAQALYELNTGRLGGAAGGSATLEAYNAQIDELKRKLNDRSIVGAGKYLADALTLGKAPIESAMDWKQEIDGVIKKRDELLNSRGSVKTFAEALLGGSTGPTLDPLILKMGEFAAKVPQARGTLDDLAASLEDLAVKSGINLNSPVEDWLPSLAKAYEDSQRLGNEGSAAVFDFGDALGDVADEAGMLEQKIKDIRTASEWTFDLLFGVQDAEIQWFDTLARSLETLNGNITDTGLEWDLSTAKGRANAKAVADIVRGGEVYIENLRDQKLSAEELTQKKEDQIHTMEIEFERLGLNKEEVRRYTDAVRSIPTHRGTTITVDAESALARIARVKSEMASIKNAYAYVDVDQITYFPRQAKGGYSLSGGWSWVGERGPELMHVPTGATVVPLTDRHVQNLAEGSGMGGTTVVHNTTIVRGDILSDRRRTELASTASRRGYTG